MKKALKFLLPILILTVLVTIFAFPSSAAADEVGYAVWNSEADYLANPNKPIAKFDTAQLTTSNLTGRGYVLCYSDVFVSAQVQLDRRQEIVIDLNGYEMTASAKIIVNGSSSPSWLDRASLTIKNGKLVHIANQFIQPRPNSEIYFENLDIHEKSQSGNFVYDAGVRIIHFKNSTFTIEPECAGIGIISLAAAYTGIDADKLKPKEEDGTLPNYERNVVFENSQFIDNSTKHTHKFIYVRGTTNTDFLNVNFIDGAGFNKIDDTFIVHDNGEYYTKFNIAKGARFASDSIPFEATKYSINYYDKIEVYGDKGNFVAFGNETDLLMSGEQNPENPELIWGKSGDEKYPYQLCQKLCNVTWVANEVETTVEGYADGLKIRYPAEASGYYFGDDGNMYIGIHEGWSKNEDLSDWVHTVTITEDATFYAVFSEGKVAIVEYNSPDMKIENIESAILTNEVTSSIFAGFKDGAYVCFYDDIYYVTDDKTVIDKNLTIDLCGNTLYKNLVFSPESGSFYIEGGNLTIKNGRVSSSRTHLATLNGGTLNVSDEATLLYDTSSLINVNFGKVNINGSTVEHKSTDNYVPAILYTGESGNAVVNINDSTVKASGALASYLPVAGDGLDMTLSITDCAYIGADSLFALYSTVADNVPAGSKMTFTMENSGAKTKKVFDVSNRSSGKTSLDGTYTIGAGCYLDAIPNIESGRVVLPEGMSVLAVSHETFGYMVASNTLTFKFNLHLGTDLLAYFYIPAREDIAYFESYSGITDVKDLDKITDGDTEYYVGSVGGISVSDALDVISVKIGFIDENGNVFAMTIDYDPIDYFEVLLSDNDPLVRKLAAASLSYIKAAYEYSLSYIGNDAKALFESENYLINVRAEKEIVALPDVDRGNIGVAFTGAQLYLSNDLAIRFNLRSDFTGTLNILGAEYSVIDGKVGEFAYIEISLSALELYKDVIEITGTTGDVAIAGEYSLTSYVNAMTGNDDALNVLLDSLFAYCYEAFVTYNGGVLPPYIDHTPPIDAEFR